MKLLLPAVVALIVLASSCNWENTYTYSVANSTDTVIAIHMKTLTRDTIVEMGSGKTETIYIAHQKSGIAGPDPIDISKHFSALYILKGADRTPRDFLDKKEWQFEETGKRGATYSTTIKNQDF